MAEIQAFIESKGITLSESFRLMQKIDVNGPNKDPLYAFLRSQAKGFMGTIGIKWNFTKFLVDKEGRVVMRFSPTTDPNSMEADILKLL